MNDPNEKLAASRKYSGNKLTELEAQSSPLGRGAINKLFTNAAAYAHDNNLLKSQTPGGGASGAAQQGQGASATGGQNNGSYGGNQGGGGGFDGNQGGSPSAGSNQRQQTPAIAQKVMDFAIKEGLTQGAIADLRRAVQGSRDLGKLDQGKQESLKLIGFAFLKNL